AILAVTGHYGLFEANDYRGRRILAYTLPVPDTSWGIVVKMDIEEAVTHSQGLLKTTVAVVAIFIAFVGAVVWQWWRRDKAERQANRQLQEAQFRLLQSEAVLNEAQQLVHLGSWELDLVADSLTWSNESFYIFEVDPDRRDISYQTFVSIVHPDDRDFVDRAYTTSVREKSTYDIEHRLLFADGRIKWVHERCVTFYDEDGKPLRSVGTTQDITERKRMEENLRGSEMKFRALYESSSDAIMLLDEKGFFDCNEAALRMFGCATHDDFINKHPSELSPPTQPGGQDSVSLADERIAEAFRNGSNRFEWVHCRLDGTEFFSEVSLSSMTLDGRRILQATVRDITGRKQAEEKLRKYNEELEAINHQLRDTKNLLLQSDKMASIGQLAAGVAHEINNPIGYVNSNLGTLDGYLKNLFEVIATYKEMEDTVADSAALARVKAVKDKVDLEFLKEDVLSLMDESREGITRVKKIVQDLKDFSRVDAGDEWHRANLHQGLDSTLNVARNEIKYKADVKKEYGGIPDVECLPSQLNQVFMNLLVNAAHAIEERGTITIRTGSQGDEVWVEVEDTGKGIAPEHIGKIFEPFFTTKPVGQGTGLGLSLSYGIIQKHHGRIEVKSEVGKGTSFKVWLPARQPQELPGRGEEKLT
ncbi:MAG: PAS domain S-box protein, partial [Gallionella sp.]